MRRRKGERGEREQIRREREEEKREREEKKKNNNSPYQVKHGKENRNI